VAGDTARAEVAIMAAKKSKTKKPGKSAPKGAKKAGKAAKAAPKRSAAKPKKLAKKPPPPKRAPAKKVAPKKTTPAKGPATAAVRAPSQKAFGDSVRDCLVGTPVWYTVAGGIEHAAIHRRGSDGAIVIVTDAGSTAVVAASNLFETAGEARAARGR
jgi:hypothetical protein